MRREEWLYDMNACMDGMDKRMSMRVEFRLYISDGLALAFMLW